jgi:hypothetical protein
VRSLPPATPTPQNGQLGQPGIWGSQVGGDGNASCSRQIEPLVRLSLTQMVDNLTQGMDDWPSPTSRVLSIHDDFSFMGHTDQ